MALCLETEQLETVQRILSLHFEGLDVWAYGPRLTGVDLTPETELDLAVIADRPLSFEAMTAVERRSPTAGSPSVWISSTGPSSRIPSKRNSKKNTK